MSKSVRSPILLIRCSSKAGIHCSEQREEGERHVTTGCAVTYPGGYRATRTGSTRQAAGGRQYLRIAAKGIGEQTGAACSLLRTSWG